MAALVQFGTGAARGRHRQRPHDQKTLTDHR
jgi:hypothetical protein